MCQSNAEWCALITCHGVCVKERGGERETMLRSHDQKDFKLENRERVRLVGLVILTSVSDLDWCCGETDM